MHFNLFRQDMILRAICYMFICNTHVCVQWKKKYVHFLVFKHQGWSKSACYRQWNTKMKLKYVKYTSNKPNSDGIGPLFSQYKVEQLPLDTKMSVFRQNSVNYCLKNNIFRHKMIEASFLYNLISRMYPIYHFCMMKWP